MLRRFAWSQAVGCLYLKQKDRKNTSMARDLFDRDRIVGSVRGLGAQGLHNGLSTLGDFKKFLLRGNVVDLAVGVVIGAAFNNVVQEFTKDFITPLLGLFGGVPFLTWKLTYRNNDFALEHLSMFL